MHTHASERPLVYFIPAEGDQPAVIIPTLETPKAIQAGIPSERIFNWGDDEGFEGAFAAACAALALSGQTIAVESLYMAHAATCQLTKTGDRFTRNLRRTRSRTTACGPKKTDQSLPPHHARAVDNRRKTPHAILPSITP
jgi:hypothetical protein